MQRLPKLIKNKIIRKKKVKINNPILIIFKSLCKKVMTMFVSKVATRKFNNKGPKVKAIKSLIKQSTTPKAGASTTSLKLIPPIIPIAPTAIITANQIANLMGKFKKMNLTLV